MVLRLHCRVRDWRRFPGAGVRGDHRWRRSWRRRCGVSLCCAGRVLRGGCAGGTCGRAHCLSMQIHERVPTTLIALRACVRACKPNCFSCVRMCNERTNERPVGARGVCDSAAVRCGAVRCGDVLAYFFCDAPTTTLTRPQRPLISCPVLSWLAGWRDAPPRTSTHSQRGRRWKRQTGCLRESLPSCT